MQRKYLKECLNDFKIDKEKLGKTSLEEKITRYYVDGKINESHRELLKDKFLSIMDAERSQREHLSNGS